MGVRWDRVLGDGLWQDARKAARPRRGSPIQRRWLAGDPAAAAGVAPGTAVVASLGGPDPVIEGLWTHQWRAGVYPALARAGFAAVVGPNYSQPIRMFRSGHRPVRGERPSGHAPRGLRREEGSGDDGAK